MIRDGQHEVVSDALVLFDSTHGTLRLTEPAYLSLDDLLAQLERSVSMTPPDDDRVSPEVVAALRTWLDHLGNEDGGLPVVDGLDDGDVWVQEYDVGSTVARRDNQGVLHDIEVVGHDFRVFDDKMQFFYLYETGKPVKAIASAESIQAVGDEWTMVYLNRETGERREFLDDEAE